MVSSEIRCVSLGLLNNLIKRKVITIMAKETKKKTGSIASKAALAVAKSSANSVCVLFLNQPKLPEKVKKLRKF